MKRRKFKQINKAKTQQKYYVVSLGHKTGVFESWPECQAAIFNYPHAAYRSFKTRQLAEQAFKSSSEEVIGNDAFETTTLTDQEREQFGKPIEDSISVDGAWNTATGVAEYQSVHTTTGKVIFRSVPFEDGTNNIVEYLAIVHALLYCKQHKLTLPIYSDSRTAISWVRGKKANTNHKRNKDNKELFKMVDAANIWLGRNEYPNEILKWETGAWGENPADFGRK